MLSKMNSPRTDCNISNNTPILTLQVKVDRKIITTKRESDFDDGSSKELFITHPPPPRLICVKRTRDSEHILAATHLT